MPEWRAIPPKYFENIFKTNEKVGVTRQQTWLRNEKIAEYFGENLDILTDLLWIFNNSKVFKIYFQNISAGLPFFQALTVCLYSCQILNMKFEEHLMDMLDHVQMNACDTKLQYMSHY